MTKNPKIIRGAGGPPPPRKPFRAPDTLHSRQFATVQDLISEGEIEGFATPSKAGITDRESTAYNNAALKDVFLNDTPILNQSADNTNPANSDFNFQDVTFKARFGLGTQSIMTGIPTEARRPIAVSTADVLQSGSGVVKAVNNQCDAVIVTLTWAQIQKSEDNGDIHGSTVKYKISVQGSGESVYTERVNTSVTGRTADSYSRDHRLEMVDASGNPLNFPVNIKVERITPDASAAGFLRDEFKFSFIQEVIETTNTYNNSAYVGLRVDSKIFNSIPKRSFRVRGIKVRIPGAGANNSGTPTVDLQTGRIIYPPNYIFNGTMQSAKWCSCPAMILLDLLITKRYGLGDHIAADQTNDSTTYSNIDLFSFFAASRYSNELVPDGTPAGTEEARFSCNVNIQSPKEAYTAINELAGVMRCMPIWSAGTINISQDEEKNASYLFNLANVGEEGFNYQGSSLKQRHSVISVSYFNMDSKEIDFEVVEDDAAIAKLGTIVKQVKAFACTSRGQAARLGRAILFAEQNESETVTFTTSIDSGMLVRPGAVIEINDPVRAGARRGGRVVAATTGSITIDAATSTLLTHTDGQGNISGPGLPNSPTISVILPDGTVETRTIDAESSGVLTLDSALSAAPNVNSPYLISSTTLATQQFRVIQVEEQDDINYVITALTYVQGKYDFIEKGEPLPTRNISLLNNPVNSPSNLTATETTIVINGIARSRLLISWKQPTETFFATDGSVYEKPQGASSYQLNYRMVSEDGNADNFITQEVFSNDFEIMDTKKGSVDVEVYSYNASGKLSTNPVTGTIQTLGKSGSPDNVTGLTIEPINEQLLRLRFQQSTSVDVLHGGRVYVRHSNLSETLATFQSAQDVVEAVPGNANEVICPALTGTYLLKFQDDTGNFSETVAKVTSSLVDIIDSVTVKEDREDTDSTPYNGNKAFVNYDNTQGGLILTNPVNNSTGEYHFVNSLDLGGIFTINLQRHFQGVGFYSGVNFDSRTEKIDTWLNFDGTEAPNANAKMQVATTDLDPTQALTAKYILTGLPGTNKGGIAIQRVDSNGNAIAHNLAVGDTIFLSITDGLGTNFPDMDRDYVINQVFNTTTFQVVSNNQFNVTSSAANCTISNKFRQLNDIASGSVKGRGFRFKIQLTTTDTAQNMNLQQAGYKATMLAREEQSSVIASGAGAKAVTFTKPFFVGTSGLGNLNNFLPSVNISPQNMATGDYFVLSNISGTGFTVHFKNSSNASIDRNFTYTAAGFGKGG